MESSDGVNLGLTGSTGEALTLIQVFAFKRINKYSFIYIYSRKYFSVAAVCDTFAPSLSDHEKISQ